MTTPIIPKITDIRSIGPFHSTITLKPLERGFGHTLGNALRRVMMSSIPGFAATEVKIEGVVHELASVEGMREEVLWLLLNLKNVVFKLSDSDKEVLHLVKEGPASVVASDIQLTQNAEIVNPDHTLATLARGGKLEMEVTVESGMGYQPATAREEKPKRFGALYLDASFGPVKRVSFRVEAARLQNRVDLDQLVLDIETNGVFEAEEIMQHAARILIRQFEVFANFGEEEKSLLIEGVGKNRESAVNPTYSEKVEELELNVRSQNCLRQGNIRYIGELVQKTEKELMQMPNFGRTSLREIKHALMQKYSLDIGVELSGWRAPR